jgi:hypothetical protein
MAVLPVPVQLVELNNPWTDGMLIRFQVLASLLTDNKG